MTLDLQAVQTIANETARHAGSILLGYFGKPHRQETKASASDIVTEADKASEAYIAETILGKFPTHHLVGEEGGGQGASAESADYFWYVDPLDGTANYASNTPLFTVSIALADKQNRPLVGTVYDPIRDELYTAVTGQGATLNGAPIRVSTTETLMDSILATGFPYDRITSPQNNLNEWLEFTMLTRGLRRLGSAALELAWVAAGRFDGYWEQKINMWDYMAGMLLVQEAGGRLSDYQGDTSLAMYTSKRIVASNRKIHAYMVEVIKRAQAAIG